VEYTVPATGELLLMCHLPGHLEKGMQGRVELRTELGSASAVPAVSR
jgi:uncharacterized cupredoxin-like copper-binding protein